ESDTDARKFLCASSFIVGRFCETPIQLFVGRDMDPGPFAFQRPLDQFGAALDISFEEQVVGKILEAFFEERLSLLKSAQGIFRLGFHISVQISSGLWFE